MGTIQIDGSTPKITVGNATAEDATILFDGNAQDFYIALDDSADDLLIGLGSTVGTTPAISIDENLAIKTYGDITMTGTTPVLTIGDAGAEDTAIVFDGNAQDFYIALDDSADDLLIGKGSTVGTTPAIAIDENLKVNIPVTTASTSASTGSLTTGGGAGIGADLYVGDDAYLITDSAVLGFGADKDTTLTHTDGTGLTLNSTNKLCFNDASQFVQGSSATVLSIGATDEIDLTATAVDLNGTLNVSGVATFQATPVFPDGSLALADLDIDGGTDIGAAIVDADLFIVDDGAGGTNRKTVASRLKTYIGNNTPAFAVTQSSAQTIANSTLTKIQYNNELFDTDSDYDNSSNYRFTASVAGKYFFYCSVRFAADTATYDLAPYKNGSQIAWVSSTTASDVYHSVFCSFSLDLSATDYIEIFVRQNSGGNLDTHGGSDTFVLFGGHRLIA